MQFDLEIVGDATETRFRRDGTTYRVRVVRFFLGRLGPYTEEWPVEEFTDMKFNERVTALRTQLNVMGAK